ncbi:hypothetical protein LTR53_018087, partial [Teratosphaeriaceae sp. CCFEE 6253]
MTLAQTMGGPIRSPEKNSPALKLNNALPTPTPSSAAKQAASAAADSQAGDTAQDLVDGTSHSTPNSLAPLKGAVKALDALYDIISARESLALATQADLTKLREQLQAQCTAQATQNDELATKTAELATKSSELRTVTVKLKNMQGQLDKAQEKARKRGLNIIMSQAGHPTKLYFFEKKHSLASLMA